MSTLSLILTIVGTTIGIILALSGALASYTFFKAVSQNGKVEANDSAISSFEKELGILQVSVHRLENENKELKEEQKRLREENANLKAALAMRTPEFENMIKSLSETLPKLNANIELNNQKFAELNNGANARYGKIEECSVKILELLEKK